MIRWRMSEGATCYPPGTPDDQRSADSGSRQAVYQALALEAGRLGILTYEGVVRVRDCPRQVNHVGLVDLDKFLTITDCVIH